ncbi:hypothetical protein AB1K62_03015 [Parasphingorhabdus sp. JC815]|uniref:hypothetical protein n=1 Tax=Parasphingorhabdus sp. JC815 TaxID=3232140 RepID=UPI00345768E2
MKYSLSLIIATLAITVTSPLQAQPLTPSSVENPSAETVASCTAEVTSRYAMLDPQEKKRLTMAEMIKTCSINSSMIAFANAQNEAFANNQRAHEAAVAEYEASKAAYKQQVLQQQADYENARDQWRKDVEACERGDMSKCALPPVVD